MAEAKKRGHAVTAVRCPQDAGTARALEKKLKPLAGRNDVLVMAAAVCDVRPAKVSPKKIKKQALLRADFVKNPDILARLARGKKKEQVFIGFAIESENFLENGFKKLKSKSLELLVLQKITEKESPFGKKIVHFIVLEKGGARTDLGVISKRHLAEFLIREAEKLRRGAN